MYVAGAPRQGRTTYVGTPRILGPSLHLFPRSYLIQERTLCSYTPINRWTGNISSQSPSSDFSRVLRVYRTFVPSRFLQFKVPSESLHGGVLHFPGTTFLVQFSATDTAETSLNPDHHPHYIQPPLGPQHTNPPSLSRECCRITPKVAVKLAEIESKKIALKTWTHIPITMMTAEFYPIALSLPFHVPFLLLSFTAGNSAFGACLDKPSRYCADECTDL
jgi:hypothetical protein